MTTILQLLNSLGGVAHRSDILASGVSAYELGRARHSGTVLRVRRAWYAAPEAPGDLLAAVRVGGAATAVTAARLRGLWAVDDELLHVSVAQNASRLRSRRTRFVALSDESRTGSAVCVHWRRTPGADTRVVRSVVEMLIDAIECQPEEYAIAIIDSALNKKMVRMGELRLAFADLPRRYRRALAKSDAKSESGTETIVRVRLRALGIRLRLQVRCGIGRVDILIGDRFVIECNSKAHHTGVVNYARDLAKGLVLVKEDYVLMSLSYEQVLYEWPLVEQAIRAVIARRDHLWPRRTIASQEILPGEVNAGTGASIS